MSWKRCLGVGVHGQDNNRENKNTINTVSLRVPPRPLISMLMPSRRVLVEMRRRVTRYIKSTSRWGVGGWKMRASNSKYRLFLLAMDPYSETSLSWNVAILLNENNMFAMPTFEQVSTIISQVTVRSQSGHSQVTVRSQSGHVIYTTFLKPTDPNKHVCI